MTIRRDSIKGETRGFNKEQVEKNGTTIYGMIQMSQHTKGSTTNEGHRKATKDGSINTAEGKRDKGKQRF